jgi:tRNA modification GTPase
VVVASKADRVAQWNTDNAVRVSVTTNIGLDELRRAILDAVTGVETLRDDASISNLRHITLLRESEASLCRAQHAAGQGEPEEFVLAELHQARATLSEIVGTGADDDVLNHIFASFCIGK